MNLSVLTVKTLQGPFQRTSFRLAPSVLKKSFSDQAPSSDREPSSILFENQRLIGALKAHYLSPSFQHSQPVTLSEIRESSEILKRYIPPCDVFEITADQLPRLESCVGSKTIRVLQRFLEQNRLLIADAASPRKTGSYKECGAFYAMWQLRHDNPDIQTITASAGNHGLGVAYASNLLDMNTIIVVPTTAPDVKKNLIANLLKEGEASAKAKGFVRVKKLIEHGKNFDEANEFATRLAQERQFAYVSPYNDRDVWIGQSYNLYSALDSLKARDINMQDIHYIVVPIGGGGFAAGVGSLSKLLNPDVRIIGVEPQSHAKFSSLNPPQRHEVSLQNPGQTIADGTATKKYGDKTFFKLLECIDTFCAVSEDKLRTSIAIYFALSQIASEGAGALELASILQYSTELTPASPAPNKPIVLGFISGKNINPDLLNKIVTENTDS